ncbi:L,D-transpeptidase family protein [Hydrogenimonas sp. SS33]|uniref:L,D-transpeptidase family protein n=1 Tax=Hydrogenimonas leucolamina TaxID=2954236 RepID=UPI00336C0E8A
MIRPLLLLLLLAAGLAADILEEAKAFTEQIRHDTTLLCGLRRYGVEDIETLARAAAENPDLGPELEKLLDQSRRRYRHDRLYGCMDPEALYPGAVGIDRKEINSTVSENLLVRRLEKALHRYEALEKAGGWSPIHARFTLLEPGQSDIAVAALKARLAVTGDYNGSCDANLTYGGTVVEAVKIFQGRHGLKVDGVVGPQTLHALNLPVSAKIERLKINIERARWLAAPAKDFLAVNIPDFSLTLYCDEKPALHMKCIVGRKRRATPMLSDTLTYAVLNPYWRAPETIVSEDILPKLKAGRYEVLKRKGIVAVRGGDGNETVDFAKIDWRQYDAKHIPFIFMQKPGRYNYLGLVKFMFPNDFDVYLHDTPHDELFSRRIRTFSSGCIRVEKPIELFHALANPGKTEPWSYKTIVRTFMNGKERLVGFTKPVPVFLLYMTAFVDDEGRVAFRPDIYGYDLRMRSFLNQYK